MAPDRLGASKLIVLSLLFAAMATPGVRAASWYTVEVVVFERLDAGPWSTSEQWSTDPGEPRLTRAIELTSPERTEEGAGQPHAFRLLPTRVRDLNGVMAELRAHGDYRPLLHAAWRQPGFSQGRARPVHLRSGSRLVAGAGSAAPPAAFGTFERRTLPSEPSVEGTVRMYRSRYLHVEADLIYYRPGIDRPAAATETQTPGSSPLGSSSLGSSSLGPSSLGSSPTRSSPLVFRLQESRRMRSGEMHYFDHPLFGMLVQVTPFELPAAEPPAGEGAPADEEEPAGPSASASGED